MIPTVLMAVLIKGNRLPHLYGQEMVCSIRPGKSTSNLSSCWSGMAN
jgi:hypothetical protein